jgi:hypothetical protein
MPISIPNARLERVSAFDPKRAFNQPPLGANFGHVRSRVRHCGMCRYGRAKPHEPGHDLIEIAAAEPVVAHGGTKMRDYWRDF